MNLRKIASLTALISFILEIVTSIILYIVPQGRVAYWSDWHFWGLSKSQWDDLHINLGVLLLVAIILHAYYNWSLIVKYLNNRLSQLTLFTPDFNIALLVTIIFTVGTYFNIPPFSTILNFSESIKDKASVTYGEPPYGHAELSTLKSFTQKTELNLDESLEKLRTAGIKVTGENQTLAEIARANQVAPKDIYMRIKPAPISTTGKKILPLSPAGGFGKKPLAEVCLEYDLDCETIINILAENNLSASKQMSLKEIGEKYGRNPHDIYDLLK